jgi:hypothetical protein
MTSPFGEHAGRIDSFRDALAAISAAVAQDGDALDAILDGTPDLRELAIAIASCAARVAVAFCLGDAGKARAMLAGGLAAIAAAEAAQDGR